MLDLLLNVPLKSSQRGIIGNTYESKTKRDSSLANEFYPHLNVNVMRSEPAQQVYLLQARFFLLLPIAAACCLLMKSVKKSSRERDSLLYITNAVHKP